LIILSLKQDEKKIIHCFQVSGLKYSPQLSVLQQQL